MHNDKSCGPGTQQWTRICEDGSAEKCQESDFRKTVSCNLKDCPKTFGEWADDGSCLANGHDPLCGPGTQNQTRICTEGTVDNCTDSDRYRIVRCNLPDCQKTTGAWNDEGPCKPDAIDRSCGPGTQAQKRNCVNGTVDMCTNEDTRQEVRCNLDACPKLLGNWTSDGTCISSGDHKICGKGIRKQKRSCVDGTLDRCTSNDTTKYIECSLPSCFNEVGDWKNTSGCIGEGTRKDCGKAFQKQYRTCIDGKLAPCTLEDKERDVPCDLPDCSIEFGPWINENECKAVDGRKCGPGIQRQKRTCVDGTILKCTSSDMFRTQSCNLPHCPKLLGDWNDVGSCVAIGSEKNCGPGYQIQTRSCTDGTTDLCTQQDQRQIISCNLPNCPIKFGPWINIGKCAASNPDKPCDATGWGTQEQKRDCTDGTNEKCTESDTVKTVACEILKCPG